MDGGWIVHRWRIAQVWIVYGECIKFNIMLNRLKTPRCHKKSYNPNPKRLLYRPPLKNVPLNSPQERCLAECSVSAKMRLKKLGVPINLSPVEFRIKH